MNHTSASEPERLALEDAISIFSNEKINPKSFSPLIRPDLVTHGWMRTSCRSCDPQRQSSVLRRALRFFVIGIRLLHLRFHYLPGCSRQISLLPSEDTCNRTQQPTEPKTYLLTAAYRQQMAMVKIYLWKKLLADVKQHMVNQHQCRLTDMWITQVFTFITTSHPLHLPRVANFTTDQEREYPHLSIKVQNQTAFSFACRWSSI
jgi:hypothetical protein